MRCLVFILLILNTSAGLAGQPVAAQVASAEEPPREAHDEGGHHARRPGRALLEVTGLNIGYGLFNLARGQVTARITPASWWHNMQHGWEWDLDRFLVNQIGHPFQGSQYFAAGRANGLGFYESAALTAFGSGSWEYFGETNRPSLNDFLNTTMGGVALGEVLHRTASLVRGRPGPAPQHRWRSIAALAVDPVTGVHVLAHGESAEASTFPTHMAGIVSAGLLRRGNNLRATPATVDPFVQIDLVYGDAEWARSRTPFDAFDVRFMAGGGGSLTEARVKGRLLGQPLLGNRLHFSIVQGYHYLGNDAYRFGAQAFEAHLRGRRDLSSQLTLALELWGGLTVLGAVDSRPLARSLPDPVPPEPVGQGVSVGPRNYDYGPGTTFGVSTTLTRRNQPFVNAQYEGRTLYSLDGVRVNHVLQRARLDVLVPLSGRFGVGASGDQDLRNIRTAPKRRDVQRRAAVGVSRVHALRTELAHILRRSARCGRV